VFDDEVYGLLFKYIYIHTPKGGGSRVYLEIRSDDGGVDRKVVSICEHSDEHTNFKFKIRV
jgi:hypothetical protein